MGNIMKMFSVLYSVICMGVASFLSIFFFGPFSFALQLLSSFLSYSFLDLLVCLDDGVLNGIDEWNWSRVGLLLLLMSCH